MSVTTPMIFAQEPGAQTTAADMYEHSIELYERGQLLESKELLLQIDLVQLNASQRADVRRLNERIDAEIQNMPLNDLRLLKAELALSRSDYRGAASGLQAVIDSPESTPEQRAEAERMMADVDQAQGVLEDIVPQLLSAAITDFEAGRYDEAKKSLDTIYSSGVTLTLDQQNQLNAYLGRILELEAIRGASFRGDAMSWEEAQAAVDARNDALAAQPVIERAAEPRRVIESQPAVVEISTAAESGIQNVSREVTNASAGFTSNASREANTGSGAVMAYQPGPGSSPGVREILENGTETTVPAPVVPEPVVPEPIIEETTDAVEEMVDNAANAAAEMMDDASDVVTEVVELDGSVSGTAGAAMNNANTAMNNASTTSGSGNFSQPDLVEQARRAEINALLANAESLKSQGQWQAALAAYDQILSIDPTNQAAQVGQAEAQMRTNEGALLDPTIQDDQLVAEQLRVEFNNLLSQAEQRRSEGDFIGASDMVAQATIILDQGRRNLSVTEYEAMSQQAMDMRVQIDQGREQAQLNEARARENEIKIQRAEQQLALEKERARRIAEKIDNIRRLQRAQKYDEALLELDALLFMDRGNPVAIALKEVIEDLQVMRRYDAIERDQNQRIANESIRLFESTRFPKDIVEYPEDWPVLTVRRSDGIAFLDTETDRRVWNSLANARVPVNFQGHELGDVVNYIAEVASINVDVDWKALESEFIDRHHAVNLRLDDSVPMRVVLDRVLAQLGEDDDARPQYAIRDGILTISTKEKLQRNPVTHVYDIRDLLVEVPYFDDAPDLSLDSILDNSSERDFNDRLFGEGDGEDYDRGRMGREDMIEKIREILTTTIDPRSWQMNGGDVGVIQELNGNLIITTTTRNHRDISNLLAKLREIRSLQISVESRFLLVNEDFFEQIGFDVDIFWGGAAFNRDARVDDNLLPSDLFVDPRNNTPQSRPQRQYISLFDLRGRFDGAGNPIFDANNRQVLEEVLPDAGVFELGRDTFTPWSLQQDTLGMAESLLGADAASFAGAALGRSPALSYAISYLDEIQVDLLIKATQADRRNIQLTAPKLTFFNGQRAFVQVTTSQFFVSDLQPVVGDSSAGFDPQLNTVREGVVLDVEGTVSADRRYVTMTVLTSLAKILDIQTTAVPIVVGGNVVSSDDPNSILSQTAFIERPVIQITRVNTTVTVPDKGTIMLGGQSIRNDIEIETGVPVLSKIPIINRFFTNRLTTTEERTLLILLRPTVIIQQENEELLFPGLQDAVRNSGSFTPGF